jgi:transposase
MGIAEGHARGLVEGRLMAKKPRMLVAIALANKMARAIWAMLTKQVDYRNTTMLAP